MRADAASPADPAAVDPRRLAYTEAEAAELIGVSTRTLFNLREQGRIAFVRIGTSIRYRPSALRAFLREHEVPAGGSVAAAFPTTQ